MANVNVAGLIKEADAALKQKDEIREKVAGLREILRFAVKAGEASAAEAEWVTKAFPPRAEKEAENGTAATATK